MKPTPYNESVNERYPVPVLGPKYPECYILHIDDIVEQFIARWNAILEFEILAHPSESETVFPEVYTIGPDGQVYKQTYTAQHISQRRQQWHPDISLVIAAAIEAIKAKGETEQDLDIALGMLWIDVAHMADIQLRSNVPDVFASAAISNTRRQIADIAMQFGKQLFHRLIEYGMYKHNRFPYHYVGWTGDCALVALDEEVPDPRKAIELNLE